MKRWAGLAVVVVLAGTVAVLRVLDWPHVVLLAGCVAAMLLVWPHPASSLPRLPELPLHSHPGARRDLSTLSWAAIDREGFVSQAVVNRVRQLAADDPGLESVRRSIDATASASPAQLLRWLDQATADAPVPPTRQGES